VAPALTLTDKEYQIMRNGSIAVLREIGVETGGSNGQRAINPADGQKPEEPFIVDVVHHEGDFVDVPCQHNAQLGVRVLDMVLVAVDVLIDRVHVRFRVVLTDLLDALLESGRARRGQ